MPQSNLFKLADLATFVELPGDIREARLTPHFTDVETFRFRPQLQQVILDGLAARKMVLETYVADLARYNELAAQVPAPVPAPVPPVAPLPSALDAVLDAARGLVANAVLARFWPFAQTKLTKVGLTQKNIEQSEPISGAAIARQVAVFQQSANSYEVQLERIIVATQDAIRLELNMPPPTSSTCTSDGRRRSGSPVSHLTIRRTPRGFDDCPSF